MNELSGIQKFFKMFVSDATFAAMENESRAWKVKCEKCNHLRSIWELGGIRYKAAGSKMVQTVCPNCGQRRWHSVYKIG